MKKILFSFTLLFIAMHSYADGMITSYRNGLIFTYSRENSIHEDDVIKLEIFDQKLWAINKTNKTIFIDMSQCFIFHNGESKPMFDFSQNNKDDDKKASKRGISMKNDQYITIAPSMGLKQNETFICDMFSDMEGEYLTSETVTKEFSDYDIKFFNLIDELSQESLNLDPKKKKYEHATFRSMTEVESIDNIAASVAYAFTKNTEEWTNIALSTWVNNIILAPMFLEKPFIEKKESGFLVKETAPFILHVKADCPFGYDEERNPVVVFDWVGKYKKGKFKLKFINLYKNNEEKYRVKVRFDGKDANWGEMYYNWIQSDIKATRQSDPWGRFGK